MFSGDPITNATIRALFAQEIAEHHGKISDTYEDGRRLFLRSILPEVAEVRARDRVQGGVALRSNGSEAWVHPYVFRQVCSNGGVIAQAIQTRHSAGIDVRSPDAAEPELREAIQACALPEAFTAAAEQMRSAREVSVDLALTLMPLIDRFPAAVVSQIMRHVFEDGDRSAFGLANAITATAARLQTRKSGGTLRSLAEAFSPIQTHGFPALMAAPHRHECVAVG